MRMIRIIKKRYENDDYYQLHYNNVNNNNVNIIHAPPYFVGGSLKWGIILLQYKLFFEKKTN